MSISNKYGHKFIVGYLPANSEETDVRYFSNIVKNGRNVPTFLPEKAKRYNKAGVFLALMKLRSQMTKGYPQPTFIREVYDE